MKGCTLFEHVIESPGDFVSGSHDGLLGTGLALHTPVEGPEDTVRAAADRLGGQPESLAGAIVGFERPAAQHLAARDVIVRRQSQPGAEVLVAGKRTQV